MANKRKPTATMEQAPVDIMDLLAIHIEISDDALRLIKVCHQLQQHGKTGQARKLLQKIKRLAAQLQELEARG